MRALARDGAMTTEALVSRTGLEPGKLEAAVTSLLSDGSVVRCGEALVIDDT
jgi:hypothetical protein